jgi:hypothetical protein
VRRRRKVLEAAGVEALGDPRRRGRSELGRNKNQEAESKQTYWRTKGQDEARMLLTEEKAKFRCCL